MNSKKPSELKETVNRLFQTVFNWASILAVAIALLYWGPQLMAQSWFRSIVQQYSDAFHSVQVKISRLRHDEEENARLHLENAKLTLKVEARHFDCALKGANLTTQVYELKLTKETGTRVGRTLSALNYRVPEHLSPVQLYSLGLNAIKAHDGEKVAAIFTSLTGLEGSDVYKTAQNYMITGVAWYRLENYLLADFYFDEALKQPETPVTLQFQAQSRLWKALVAKQLKDEEKSQAWLKDLVDHHPHSVEVGWVNVSEVKHDEESE
jgi:tetratricopeptide (TPR) repeat protein